MKVLMIGVDKKAVGGMWTVVQNYLSNNKFCNEVGLKYIPTATSSSKYKKIIFSLKALYKVFGILRKENIDIVHIHMAEKGSVFREGAIAIFAKALGVKVIIHMHGASFEEWYYKQKKIMKKLIKWIINKCDIFIILGEQWRRFFETIIYDNSKINVLHNSVSVPKYNKYDLESKEIIFLGMLIQRKGIDDLLKAISEIKNDFNDDVIFKLYGSDKDGNIKSKINNLGLSSIVKYSGWITDENKEECFKKAMINILPSYNEGLPMSILETMSYGIPNISSNIAAIPEAIINEENGILIEPGDIKSLGKSILQLANSKQLRKKYSDLSYERAKNMFDLENHIDNLKIIYNKIYIRS